MLLNMLERLKMSFTRFSDSEFCGVQEGFVGG